MFNRFSRNRVRGPLQIYGSLRGMWFIGRERAVTGGTLIKKTLARRHVALGLEQKRSMV